MFKNRSLKFKVYAVLALALLGCAVVAGTGYYSILRIGDAVTRLTRSNDQVNATLEMDSLLQNIRNTEKVFIMEETPEGMDAIGKRLDKLELELRGRLAKYRAAATAQGKIDSDKITNLLDQWKPVDVEMRAHALANRDKEATALARGKSREIMVGIGEILDQIVARNLKRADEADADIHSTQELAQFTLITVSLAAFLLSLTLGYFMMQAVNRSITQIVGNLDAASNQTQAASVQVASSSQALAQGASELAANLEETSSTLEEISQTTAQNTKNTEQAAGLASTAQSGASKGAEAMTRMIERIEAINESAGKTSGIVKTIDEIAFQTNLLALNAAVEAARAGDAGRGFAVVAEEVRNLAQRSAEAAKQTSALIAESQKRAQQGVQASEEAGARFGEIVKTVESLNAVIREVAVATRQQSDGVTQINDSVSQMDSATQSTAANAEENAAASEQLSAQSQMLRVAMVDLSQLVLGANGASHTAQPAIASSARPAVNAPGRGSPAGARSIKGSPLRERIERDHAASQGAAAPQAKEMKFRDI